MGKKPEQIMVDLILAGARYWLIFFIAAVTLFIIPIVGYPWLMSTGNPVLVSIASIIFTMYHVTCHQLPERTLSIFGFQMAVCSRCFAIYLAFLAGGFVFALPFVRNRLKIWSLKYYVIFCIPMAIDGFAQLFSVPIPRGIGPDWSLIWTVESNNLMRVITGAIFGLASSLYVLPYLQEIFSGEMHYNGTRIEKPAQQNETPK